MPWGALVQQFEPLRRDLYVQLGHARDVAAGVAQAADETELIGSLPISNTIGIVAVAAFAASAAGVLVAAITVTWRCTRSAAIAGSRFFALRPAVFDHNILAINVSSSPSPAKGRQLPRVSLWRSGIEKADRRRRRFARSRERPRCR